MRKNKTVRITFRITDEEAIDLTTMMSLEGFRSRSKFIENACSEERSRDGNSSVPKRISASRSRFLGQISRRSE